MKYCEKCGNKIEEGADFCTSCGNSLKPVQQNNIQKNKQPLSPEDNKKANMLCGLSLLLSYGIPGLGAFLSYLASSNSTIIQYLGNLISSVVGLSSIAGIVIMIIVRIKYPQNTFGKVLMWVYIVEYILLIILGIVIVIACSAAISDFNNFFSSCSSMG